MDTNCEEAIIDDPNMNVESSESQDEDLDNPVECVASSANVSTITIPGMIPVLPPQESSSIVPKVHNVVCTVDVGCRLELLRIALRLRNAEYNPQRFHAVVMRIMSPRTAALIFRSGKLVITGAKNEEAAHLACRKYCRLLQKLSFDVKFLNFKIQNMVSSCDVKFPIQIERLYSSHYQFSSYEPELFSGLVYRMVKPRVVFLIFVTGKIVITGAKSREELKEACDNLYPILKGFRKQ